MTAPERPALVPGELVDVQIRSAVVVDTPMSGWVRVRIAGQHGMLPLHDEGVTIERVAPAEWPPLRGDLWRDDEDHLWFAQVKAAQYGDDGRTTEGPRLLLAPAVETPQRYGEQRHAPDVLLRQRGPLRLVHREPQPEPDEDDL